MTQDKAPEWAEKEAGTLALDYVDWLGRSKVDGDAEHVLTNIVALALSQAYERGQESMRERCAKRLEEEASKYLPGGIVDVRGGIRIGIGAIRSIPIEQDSEVKG